VVSVGAADRLDAVVLTAVREEFEEAQRVDDGAIGPWTEREPLLLVRPYQSVRGPIVIGLAQALDMRGVSAANALHPLIARYEPQCLAMSGVCAGRRGKVHLGDVVIGDPLYTYDAGALIVERTEDGHEHQVFRADPNPYRLTKDWRAAALSFVSPGALSRISPPPTVDEQCLWLLEVLDAGGNPVDRPDRKDACPQWKDVVVSMRAKGLLEPTGLSISGRGRDHVAEHRVLNPDGVLPHRTEIHLGAIATGQNVVRDPDIFDRLSQSMRNVLGLDMESSAVGAVAHDCALPSVVMKAVMDYGDGTKSDAFKRFAARVSAECVVSFLRQQVAPRATVVGSVSAYGRVLAHVREGLKVAASVELQTTDGEDVSSALDRALTVHRSVLLIGRGGAGKTTAIRRFVAKKAEQGTAAVLLNANAFQDDAGAWVRSGLPGGVTLDELDSDDSGRSLLLIVDGLNECAIGRQQALQSTLSQLLIRHRKLHLVCTTRTTDVDASTYGELVHLAAPDAKKRAEVLTLYNPDADPAQVEESMLLPTPLDLAQAALVWKTLPVSGRTRFGLRAGFVRQRLQHDRTAQLHALLRSFAAELFRTASLSMPTALFLRWLEKYQSLNEIGDATSLLPWTRLLEEAGGVTSFSHESLLDYFMAEHLLRTTPDVERLVVELQKPRYVDLAPLILEAQSDAALASQLLSSTAAARRGLVEVARGGNGILLKEIVERSMLDVLGRLASDLAWSFDSDPYVASQKVTDFDVDLIDCAVALATRDRRYFSLVMDSLTGADRELERVTTSISETTQKPPRSVRGRVYAASFWVVSRTRLGLLVRSNSRWHYRHSQTSAPWTWVDLETLTFGRAMFLAEFLRHVPLPDEPGECERLLLRLFDCAWSIGWGELRRAVLELIHACGRSLPETTQRTILSRLRDLPDQGVFLNSSLFEAMEALGEELDTSGAKQLSETIATILKEPSSADMRSMAYGIFSQQFEFLEALSQPAIEAIEQLAPDAKFRFHAMAALGASDTAFHSDLAIESLAPCSATLSDADRELLHDALFRWSTPWNGDFDAMPFDPVQNAANSLRAHERLARCGHWRPLDASEPRTEAWAAIAAIVAGHVRQDQQQVEHAWNRLRGDLLLHSWEAIGWVAAAILSGMHRRAPNLLEAYPNEMSSLAVDLIARRAEWVIASPVAKTFATMTFERLIDVLGKVGGPMARTVLLQLVDVPDLGLRARDAIREIDRRH
jgi:nucleoside phosphorylase